MKASEKRGKEIERWGNSVLDANLQLCQKGLFPCMQCKVTLHQIVRKADILPQLHLARATLARYTSIHHVHEVVEDKPIHASCKHRLCADDRLIPFKWWDRFTSLWMVPACG